MTASVLAVAGCQGAAEPTGGTEPARNSTPAGQKHAGHDHGKHAHPSEGPHHGDLVELGNEEYHGEVVHNEEAGTLVVYILDGAATNQVAIDATELTINVSHDGRPEQFTLTALPDDGDEKGKSSRFVSDDQDLAAHLDEEDTHLRLVVKINGTTFRGEIKHDHDHAGHNHQHE